MKDFNFDMEGLHSELKEELGNLQHEIHAALGDLDPGQETDESGEPVTAQEFEVGPAPELSISNVSGRITIETGRDGVIRIRAARHGSGRAVGNTEVEIHREGNRVTVQTRPGRSRRYLPSFILSSVDYQVQVPRDCRVRAKGTSADLHIQGTQAAVVAETVSGDVYVGEGAGSYAITTVSGDVVGQRLSGELTLRTTSGDAAIRASRLSTFNLNTVSGDVVIETPLSAGQHYLARTVSGDLLLLVPERTGAMVQMKSVSGSVVSELPAEIVKSGRRSWQGRINGGGATVEMHSISGDLRIARATSVEERTGDEGPESVAPQVADQPAEGREQTAEASSLDPAPAGGPAPAGSSHDSEMLTILKALEAGDITLDEATSRLEALE